MLYSRVQTLALIIAVTVINFFQLLMFVGTSMELVRDGRSDAQMWMLGWFQSVNSRSAGLQVFDLKRLAKVMMVVYGFFMWLNPFPIVMAMERGALSYGGGEATRLSLPLRSCRSSLRASAPAAAQER